MYVLWRARSTSRKNRSHTGTRAEKHTSASTMDTASTPYEWRVSSEAGKGWMSRMRQLHAQRAVGSHQKRVVAAPVEHSHLPLAVSPHDALDAKESVYQLFVSATIVRKRTWTVPSPVAMARVPPLFGAHRVDGPAAIGTEPHVWGK